MADIFSEKLGSSVIWQMNPIVLTYNSSKVLLSWEF